MVYCIDLLVYPIDLYVYQASGLKRKEAICHACINFYVIYTICTYIGIYNGILYVYVYISIRRVGENAKKIDRYTYV